MGRAAVYWPPLASEEGRAARVSLGDGHPGVAAVGAELDRDAVAGHAPHGLVHGRRVVEVGLGEGLLDGVGRLVRGRVGVRVGVRIGWARVTVTV